MLAPEQHPVLLAKAVELLTLSQHVDKLERMPQSREELAALQTNQLSNLTALRDSLLKVGDEDSRMLVAGIDRIIDRRKP